MGWDFAFDPKTKDTIPDGKGGVTLTNGADTKVQLQFECELGAWWGDARAGSKLRRLTEPNAIQAEAMRALNVLASDGDISNPTATATPSPSIPGRVNLLTSSRDSRTGRAIKTGDK